MSDSYPKQAKLFEKWAKAMLAGATVGKPSYSQMGIANKGKRPKRPRRRRRRRLTRIQRMRKKGE